jgi:hypothetical protein
MVTRTLKERIWIALGLVYAVIRIVGANAFLTQYGLRIWPFAIIEFLSSIVLAISTSRVVTSFVDEQHHAIGRWCLLVLVSFAAPDVYAYKATRHLPPTLVAMLAATLTVSAVSSVFAIRKKVKKVRADTTAEPSGSNSHQTQSNV